MSARLPTYESPPILSLFCGCGGLDLGFEQSGFHTQLAFDQRKAAVASHNHNRDHRPAHQVDITTLSLDDLDKYAGEHFDPVGVIGGPPCQSFSRGNSNKRSNDPRSRLVSKFFDIALEIHHARGGLDFIVMENVLEVERADDGKLLQREIERLKAAKFAVTIERPNASEYGVAQSRKRLILVGINSDRANRKWVGTTKSSNKKTVSDVLRNLPEPVTFSDHQNGNRSGEHPNHWCMTPRSHKFFDGSLAASRSNGRSFKVLDWNKPSYTVSYGHREVHVHPDGHRRLSVYEAMLLQGFPKEFELTGTLSDQISQVSEAVPPPLAKVVAEAVKKSMSYKKRSSNSAKAAA